MPDLKVLKVEAKEEPVSEQCKCGRTGQHGRCWVARGMSGPPEGKPAAKRTPRKVVAIARASEGAVSSPQKEQLLVDLRSRRDVLDQAIETIEALEI